MLGVRTQRSCKHFVYRFQQKLIHAVESSQSSGFSDKGVIRNVTERVSRIYDGRTKCEVGWGLYEKGMFGRCNITSGGSDKIMFFNTDTALTFARLMLPEVGICGIGLERLLCIELHSLHS